MPFTRRERARLEREISNLEEQYRLACLEAEETKRKFIDNLVELIELAKYDDGALNVLVQWIRSGNATRLMLYALVDRWAATMD